MKIQSSSFKSTDAISHYYDKVSVVDKVIDRHFYGVPKEKIQELIQKHLPEYVV